MHLKDIHKMQIMQYVFKIYPNVSHIYPTWRVTQFVYLSVCVCMRVRAVRVRVCIHTHILWLLKKMQAVKKILMSISLLA